ncbi:MAG TPA: DM13 domain-containing protein [Acidimicrobiia bacterium]
MATTKTAPAAEPARAGTPPPRPWWEVALRFLPAAVFLATFGVFFVQKNEQARSVFKSGRGILTLVVIVGGYVVLAVLLRRFVRWSWVAPVVLAGVVLGLATWIVRPYYVDKTDNTQLVEGDVADASEVDDPTVSSAAPDASTETTPAPAPVQPVRVAAGPIQGLAGHSASGTVSLIRNPDGSYVVRFESFDIEGTPDPEIYLVEGAGQTSPGGADLGAQRGNVGDVSDYAVPAGFEPGADWTVLVWCGQFAVEIAHASLAPA